MSSQDFSSSNPKIWASSKTLRDICEAYLDICEKKDYTSSRDQDQDGDNDFADNMIARMVASGMSREEAIRKVKNKEYNKKSQVKEETSKEKDERLAARRARVRELESQGRTETSSSRTSRSKAQKQAQARQTAAEKILADLGVSRRSSQPMGSQEPEAKPAAPEANRKLKTNTKNDTLAQKADEVLSQLRKEEKEEVKEATAMAKRGHDESSIRQRIARNTGGGESADRATALENKPTYGNDKKSKQRTRYARLQRGDFRNTTSSNPGLHGYAYKSNDPEVKAKQAARGAQRGALTPNERKQLNREAYETYEIVASYLLENNFAETIDDANVIIENMSYEWLGAILEESDHEQSMIRVELKSAMDAINRLMKKMKGEGNVEAWVQSKITRAADYLDSAAKYIDSGESE